MTNNTFELAKIEWIDSCGVSTDWIELNCMDAINPSIINSIGFIVKENDQYIVIAPHISLPFENDSTIHICGEMSIPKVSILNRFKLYHEKQIIIKEIKNGNAIRI